MSAPSSIIFSFFSFKPGYWNLSGILQGCEPCECDVGGSYERNCEQLTGQCRCRTSITGRRCDQVVDGNYFPLPDHLKYESEEAKIIGVCLNCSGLEYLFALKKQLRHFSMVVI